MQIITTFAPGSQVPSGTLNPMQTRAMGMVRATQNNDLSALGEGVDARIWQRATALPAGQRILIDDTSSLDWRDRILFGAAINFTAVGNIIGGATDYVDWSTLSTSLFFGYTRTGAYSDVALGTLVSNGNPPLAATGAGGTSARVTLASLGNVYLYTDPSGADAGKLFAYNDTAGDVFLLVWVFASGDTGKH